MNEIIPLERIASKIIVLRNQKVILDRDLASLYDVETRVLNQAVTRNIKRFPDDFMFKLTKAEKDELVTNCDRFQLLKHSSVMPHAFTENGVAMLSSILKSDRAIRVNIDIMRAFTKLRQMLSNYDELKQALIQLSKKHDQDIQIIFMELDRLNDLLEPKINKKQIGFKR